MSKRIRKVLTDNGLRPDLIEATYNGIKEYYNQPHRHYHTFEHIDGMLEQMDKAGWSTPELSFNVLFHDLYYQAPAVAPGHNEQVSQMMAQAVFQNCTGKISLYITPTANFMQTQKDLSDNCQKLLDLDLSSMARPNYTGFVKAQELLIKESPGTTMASKAGFLNQWLKARPDGFYYTALARVEWWPTALSNITRFIKEHGKKAAPAKKATAKKVSKPRLTKKRRKS